MRRVRLLCDFAKRALYGNWELHTNEIGFWVKIIFSRLVDDSDHLMFSGERIIKSNVQFAELKGRGVVVVPHTDGEMPV